jgi:hypothetical protein
MTNILIGTSDFTAEGWVGSFYPAGMQPRDFLSYYATKFNTVELDNTFYRTPARWAARPLNRVKRSAIRLLNCNSVFDSSRTCMGWVVMSESLLLARN